MEIGSPIESVENVTPERFHDEIVAAKRPVVMRGLVRDWPAVKAGRESPHALAAYIRRFDAGKPVETLVGRPEIRGRFFYDETIQGFNFQKKTRSIEATVGRLLAASGQDEPPAMYVQSTPTAEYLPGFAEDNRLNVLAPEVGPRIWIGNRLTVQTHFDMKDNVACVVAGRREFTLFPPNQTPNLYPGPFEFTLAGPPVSMVRLDEPDPERYPHFEEAVRHALVAELEPGDALYIPYFWWHHVRTREAFNVLVNFWWNDVNPDFGSPFDVMLHALLGLRDLPDDQRAAWKVMFDHYIFGAGEDAVAHLPENARGTLGAHDARTRQKIRLMLIDRLARQAGLKKG